MIRHLFVPGLFGPMPDLGETRQPAVPRIERLLAQADCRPEPAGFERALFALFGIDPGLTVDLPTAPVSLLGETGQPPQGFVLHADPLQLMPDRDCLRAFDLDDAPLDSEERAVLMTAFNDHFSQDGLHLFDTKAGRLYLGCDRASRGRTHPLAAVLGRNLDPFLPTGEGQGWWRGLLNETQMLCHTLEFNRVREALGRPVLGGLWFSGGGELPDAHPGPIDRQAGDSNLARGLMALQSVRGGDELTVDMALHRAVLRVDGRAWLGALAALEERVLDMKEGCESLQVHPCAGTVYQWQPSLSWRFWRRRRPLPDYGGQPSDGPGVNEAL